MADEQTERIATGWPKKHGTTSSAKRKKGRRSWTIGDDDANGRETPDVRRNGTAAAEMREDDGKDDDARGAGGCPAMGKTDKDDAMIRESRS